MAMTLSLVLEVPDENARVEVKVEVPAAIWAEYAMGSKTGKDFWSQMLVVMELSMAASLRDRGYIT